MRSANGMRGGLAGRARGQGGFSLIVALMMLIVIIILGISSSQMAINEERGARNARDRQVAFQAAEAALKDAEAEILATTSPACAVPLQFGRGRQNSKICFNEASGIYFVANCGASPSVGQGLCAYNSAAPAYLSSNVNFYADASGSNSSPNTVPYGLYTGARYPSQVVDSQITSSAPPPATGLPVSRYSPRYIIEIVPKNVAYDSCTGPAATAGAGCKSMFRVTAMGFGANSNSQVVLQSVVSTQD